jgi:hypothetical protein
MESSEFRAAMIVLVAQCRAVMHGGCPQFSRLLNRGLIPFSALRAMSAVCSSVCLECCSASVEKMAISLLDGAETPRRSDQSSGYRSSPCELVELLGLTVGRGKLS